MVIFMVKRNDNSKYISFVMFIWVIGYGYTSVYEFDVVFSYGMKIMPSIKYTIKIGTNYVGTV